jgi:hypothetical protein
MTPKRHALGQEVRITFADSELPPAQPVGQADALGSTERAFEIRYAEQPKELATHFLVANASHAGRLPPRSEAWFWRSLLLEAIEARWDLYYDEKHPKNKAVHRLVWATVYNLRPDPNQVLDGRWDYEDVQGLRQRLTLAQRVTIAHFLGAILQEPVFAGEPMADMACQAIHWCWSDDPTSTKAAKAHHMALRSYSRPTHESDTFESHIRAIEQAFADTPYPKGRLMSGGWDEPAEYELAFQGTDWRQLTPRLICHNFSAFSFMTPDAFRSFIPAVLCHELGPGSAVEFELYRVSRVIGPASDSDDIRQRVQAFTPDERWAIVNFLNFEAMMQADPERVEAYEAAMVMWESG